MAGIFKKLRSGETKETPRAAFVFDTYLEAHAEASRHRSRDAASGMISRVEKSPYGGYVVRSWPLEMMADVDMRLIMGNFGETNYQDL